MPVSPLTPQTVFSRLLGIIEEYRTGDKEAARQSYDRLAKDLAASNAMENKELESLFYDVEFFIFEHGSTSFADLMHSVRAAAVSLDARGGHRNAATSRSD